MRGMAVNAINSLSTLGASRTNLDLDDDLVAEAMKRLGVGTKREAVHVALQRVAGTPLTRADVNLLGGIGWEGDLDAMRSDATPPT